MKSNNKSAILLASITSLLISGCGDNDITTAQQEDSVAVETQLVPVTSGNELEHYLKQGFANANSDPILFHPGEPDLITSDSTLEADGGLAATDGANSSSGVSGTNLQVSGADEADRIKSDGNYLYSIKQQNYYYPVDAIAVAEADSIAPDYEPVPATISVHRIQADPAASRLLTEIDIDEPRASINGLYLNTDSAGHGQQLIATGSAGQNWGLQPWDNPWAWQSGQTKVWFYDVSEPAAPQQMHSITIEGYLLNSRRIKDTLYLVTRFTPYIAGYNRYPSSEDEATGNQDLIERTSLDELLPHASFNNADPEQLMQSRNCFLPDSIDADSGYPTLTTITAIDLNAPKEMVSVCYGGQAYGMYASTKNIYLTATRYRERNSVDQPEIASSRPSVGTAIHKFAMTERGPRYQGSGVVPGSLSINGSNPSFLMGERGEVLHIITSWRDENRWQWQHQLTNLQSNADNSTLEIIAQLPNETHPAPIGKPGEQIYASRYIGDRAYVVTFQTIDPLYVIDLSNDKKPVIAGELEIPGFSSYLHAINDDLLLGIGKNTNGPRLQGLKLSLFNVADIHSPEEISSLNIGDRGTDSPVLFDHHTLAYLPGTERTPDKFTIPVKLFQGGDQTQPWQWADWKHDGLYLFEIKADSSTRAELKHSGSLIAEQASDTNTWGSSLYNDRAVIQGSAVHYLHNNKLISADWDAVTP